MQKEMNGFLRAGLFFALLVVLGLTFGFITFKILSFSRTVEVPSVINMTIIEADRTLSRAGLDMKVEGEDFDQTVPSGKVARQDQPPGSKVKEKRAIKIVISKGPRVASVPDLLNQTIENAESLLIQKGLKINKAIPVHTDTVEKGIIMAQRPEPDDRLADTITVLVSAGPYERSYSMPELTGKTLEEAKEFSKKTGIKTETQGRGNIIKSQRPKPGATIKSGEKILLEMKEVTNQ